MAGETMCLTDYIKAAGIVGAGGAGFPTHIKLNAKADYFIVNAAECEPLIETDKFLIRLRPADLIKAVDIISDFIGAKERFIAIKAKYVSEIAALEAAITQHSSTVKLHKMKAFYPAGDEQIIVREITGKSVPERGIPIKVSAVVDNVVTILNVYDALPQRGEQPITDKYLSVVGAVERPQMLYVPLGTSVKECIDAAIPQPKDYAIIMGGPMMGRVCADKEKISALNITKTDGNIIVLPENHYLINQTRLTLSSIKNRARSACIQCRMCTDLCPRYALGHSIRPHLVMRNLYRESTLESDEFLAAFGDSANCSECGLCEMYACPMQLSPRKVNAYIKGRLRELELNPPANQNPIARQPKPVPTNRLVTRLGLSKYYGKLLRDCRQLMPDTVRLPLKQHIGAAATPIVSVGDYVNKGAVVAIIPDDVLGARLHASVSGNIIEVSGNYIAIKSERSAGDA